MFNPISKMQNPAGLYSMVTQLPPQQQQPELNQLSQTGLAPTEAILYVKNQLDRLRAARQAPPPTTVMQDMQAQIQQAQMPQSAPQMPQMQAPLQSPAQSPIQPASQGLPSLPVQNVGQPQNYAGGGIVAFTKGGSTRERLEKEISDLENNLAQTEFIWGGAPPSGIAATPGVTGFLGRMIQARALPLGYVGKQEAKNRLEALKRQLALTPPDEDIIKYPDISAEPPSLAAIRQPSAPSATTPIQSRPRGIASSLPKPATQVTEPVTAPEKTPNDYLAEIEALGREKGIGKAISDREKVLAARQAASEKDLAERARMSRVQAFLRMAEEGGKPGGTFLKGATAGLSQYAEAKQAMADRRQALQERAEDLQFTIAQAKEQQTLGNMEAARRLFEKAEADKQQLAKEAREHQRDMEKIAAQEAGAKERTGMQVGAQKEIAGVTAAARAGQAQAAAQQRVATAAKTAAENSMEYQQLQTQLTSKQITPEQAQAIYDALVKREIQKILRAQQIAGGVESEPVENAADPLGIR